jgi:hypothetical protein
MKKLLNTEHRRPMTLRRFAKLTDVSPATVSKWCANGMPHRRRGKRSFLIDVREACRWLVNHANEPRAESQRERLFREQADKVALKNAETRRNLVDAVQVHEVLRGIFSVLDRQWRTLADQSSSDLVAMHDPQDVRERLTTEFAAAGQRLADAVGDMASALERGCTSD